MYRIAPSILSADFARLGEEVNSVIAAGADLVLIMSVNPIGAMRAELNSAAPASKVA